MYATRPSEGAWHTSIRIHWAGAPASAIEVQVVPPSVETCGPLEQPARTSVIAPPTGGAIDRSQVTCALREVQVEPPSALSNNPADVAARRCWPVVGSTARS